MANNNDNTQPGPRTLEPHEVAFALVRGPGGLILQIHHFAPAEEHLVDQGLREALEALQFARFKAKLEAEAGGGARIQLIDQVLRP